MRIENEELIFEEEDEAIRKTFMDWMERQQKFVDIVVEREAALDLAKRQHQLALMELKRFRMKHHEEIWGPLDEAITAQLGLSAIPGLVYNSDSQKLTVYEGEPTLPKKSARQMITLSKAEALKLLLADLSDEEVLDVFLKGLSENRSKVTH